jgi:hypothetical protein
MAAKRVITYRVPARTPDRLPVRQVFVRLRPRVWVQVWWGLRRRTPVLRWLPPWRCGIRLHRHQEGCLCG